MTIRFLIMNAFTVGGTVRTTFTTASELAKHHDVEVVSVYRRRTTPALPLDPAVRLRALTDLRRSARHTPWQRWLAARPSRVISAGDARFTNFSALTDANLLRFLVSLRDGVVIGTRPGLNLAIALLVRPSVVRIGQDHLNLHSYKRGLRAQMRAHYGRLDAVTTLTAQTAREYRELLGPATRIECIPNAAPDVGAAQATLEAPVVVAAGRLVPQKGFDRLLEAWARVCERHPDWRLRIFGDGPRRDVFAGHIERLGIGESATLEGFTPRLHEAMAAASICVMSSRSEGFPMVLLEAMSVGLPVVSFDIETGPRDIVTEGLDGYVVPDGDLDALAARMSELMSDTAKRKSFGAAARAAARRYDSAELAARWESLAAELSDERRAGGGAAAPPVVQLLRRRATRRARRSVSRLQLNARLRRLTGYGLARSELRPAPSEPRPRKPRRYDAEARETIRHVRPWTMTSDAKLHALIVVTRYVVKHEIPGAIVECGVWRGGSMQAIARTLLAMDDTDRDLHLFDTFAGMPEPTEADRRHDGAAAADLLKNRPTHAKVWAIAGLDDVRAGMAATSYPPQRVHFHPGRVEETIPGEAPDGIALLRLDTDWYESTRHELEHLYGRVPSGGVIVFDDYDHWDGARQAVDEFLRRTGARLLLAPMGSGRLAVKP